MKISKFYILSLTFVLSGLAKSQVGISTQNPQGTLHVDGAKDNPATGAPSASQAANDVVITSTGDMGVGTTVPDTKLHVVSSVANANRYNLIDATAGTNQYGIIALRNTSPLATGNYSLIGFTNSGPTSGGTNWALGSVRTGATLSNGSEEDFYIGNSLGGNLLERMRINSTTGNVGIGTSAPTNKLHVNATDPLRLEGLQASSGTSGSLTVNSTGVVQLRNSSSISAVRAIGNVSITVNNTFTTIGTPTETFDNLNELTVTTFTAAATGLYKVDFSIDFPQRANTEDGGDGYIADVKLNLNGTEYSRKKAKVTLPEVSGLASFITASTSELIKMAAGDTLTFQGKTFGSTPTAAAPITGSYTINIVRID
ncbi:hypothetical protein ODZ84_11145 [Chryseobacterium fluminis]|uniref:hypothetical protein n=1 Tax=Chryseobacterium fluminis TaxID=2983606 RepID=UPI0022588C06|nr:hypothetical protein [Chryseobacterium sp. MMS21-Ot14]UZU00081.1 hypothetical protein ODZ84_11145 [Chryseobacterium sp. MMS21-Ot14]